MRKVSFLVFVLATIWSMSALAAPPLLPVQGRLLDSGGQPVNGAQVVDFRIYGVPVGGTSLYSAQQLIDFSDGYFIAYIGESPNSLPLSLFDGAPELFLGVEVDSDGEMTPRLRLGSAPSAPFANSCSTAETLGTFGPDDFAPVHDHPYSLTSHAHAGVYALTSHPHTGYADDDHLHSGVYAVTSHPHSGYADDDHNHTGVYSPNSHLHAGIYALDSHGHGAATDVNCSGCVAGDDISFSMQPVEKDPLAYPYSIQGTGLASQCATAVTAKFCALAVVEPGLADSTKPLRARCHASLVNENPRQWRLCGWSNPHTYIQCAMRCFD